MKARGCIVGTLQRKYIKKEDAALPTVTLELLFILVSINAFEKRKTGTFDCPGAFLHAKSDEHVIIAFEGPLAELMVKVNLKIYRKYITTNKKGKPVLYAKCNAAMYGMMRSALLFYRKLRDDLKFFGFKVNPYDLCVANKIVKGTQMMTFWHVDDLHVLHANNFEITKLGYYLSNIYGGCAYSKV